MTAHQGSSGLLRDFLFISSVCSVNFVCQVSPMLAIWSCLGTVVKVVDSQTMYSGLIAAASQLNDVYVTAVAATCEHASEGLCVVQWLASVFAVCWYLDVDYNEPLMVTLAPCGLGAIPPYTFTSSPSVSFSIFCFSLIY